MLTKQTIDSSTDKNDESPHPYEESKGKKTVRPGYKHTKSGWIPEEWELLQLKTLAHFYSGTTPSRSEQAKYFDGGKFNWVKTTDLNNGILNDTEEKVTDVALKETSLKLLPKGTIVVAMYGGYRQIGRTGMFAFKGCINQALTAITCGPNLIPNYLLLYLNGNVHIWKRFAASSRKDPNITKSDIFQFPVVLPPLQEQQRIATLLTTWDRAITTTQALIKQLEARKRGLMQRLLTGEVRLPGFEREWKEYRLGDVTKSFSKRNKNLIEARIYSVTNDRGFVYQADQFSHEVAGSDLKGYKIIQRGEFAYNPARVNVGSLAYFTDEIGVISSLYVCFKANKRVLDEYLRYFLKSNKARHDLSVYGEGGVRVYLWYPLFAGIKINLPPKNEQEAIAKVLCVADREITNQQSKLNHLKRQKRGLMQQLLTGQKRLLA
ncbi:restriction endonuclease subunit S [Lewinella sp. IMCC34183]|uniref:restriction endonuclease subunit S n=1 Tax=Lewinella sp. IMCC34183 TaxID=2248762 RepID=UPI000E2291C3|nr:restriction endonuclease subunit S [Lewinella sp. IMCC34183]